MDEEKLLKVLKWFRDNGTDQMSLQEAQLAVVNLKTGIDATELLQSIEQAKYFSEPGFALSQLGIDKTEILERAVNKAKWKRRFEWAELRVKTTLGAILIIAAIPSITWNIFQVYGALELKEAVKQKQDSIQLIKQDLSNCLQQAKDTSKMSMRPIITPKLDSLGKSPFDTSVKR